MITECTFGITIKCNADYDYVPCQRKIKPSLVGTTTNCYLHKNEPDEIFYCEYVIGTQCFGETMCFNCCANPKYGKYKQFIRCRAACYQQNQFCDHHLTYANYAQKNTNSNFDCLCSDVLLLIISYLQPIDIARGAIGTSKMLRLNSKEQRKNAYCCLCFYQNPEKILGSDTIETILHTKCVNTLTCALKVVGDTIVTIQQMSIILDICAFFCQNC